MIAKQQLKAFFYVEKNKLQKQGRNEIFKFNLNLFHFICFLLNIYQIIKHYFPGSGNSNQIKFDDHYKMTLIKKNCFFFNLAESFCVPIGKLFYTISNHFHKQIGNCPSIQ